MTKEEAIAKLREQGHEVTPEELKALDALLSTGEMSEVDLDKVVGGMSPKFRNALIAAGILTTAVVGAGATHHYGLWTVEGVKKRSGEFKDEVVAGAHSLAEKFKRDKKE